MAFADIVGQVVDFHDRYDPLQKMGIKHPGAWAGELTKKAFGLDKEEEEEEGPEDNRPQFMQQGGGGQQAGQNIRPAGQTNPNQGAYGNSLRAWQGPSDPAGGATPEGFTQATNPDGSWGAAQRAAPAMGGGNPFGGMVGKAPAGPAPAPQAAMGQALRQPSAAPPPMGGPMGMQDPRKRRPFG